MTIYCRDCEHQLKPTGGRENDPESICLALGRKNFVTGEWCQSRCREVNIEGKCRYFESRVAELAPIDFTEPVQLEQLKPYIEKLICERVRENYAKREEA